MRVVQGRLIKRPYYSLFTGRTQGSPLLTLHRANTRFAPTHFHVSRFTFHVSRFTFHVSRLTFHVSRLTFHFSTTHRNSKSKNSSFSLFTFYHYISTVSLNYTFAYGKPKASTFFSVCRKYAGSEKLIE